MGSKPCGRGTFRLRPPCAVWSQPPSSRRACSSLRTRSTPVQATCCAVKWLRLRSLGQSLPAAIAATKAAFRPKALPRESRQTLNLEARLHADRSLRTGRCCDVCEVSERGQLSITRTTPLSTPNSSAVTDVCYTQPICGGDDARPRSRGRSPPTICGSCSLSNAMSARNISYRYSPTFAPIGDLRRTSINWKQPLLDRAGTDVLIEPAVANLGR
jgi:hypothetical protein